MEQLRLALDSAAKSGLDRVQRQWEAYAKAQCEAYNGGSMRPMIEATCLAQQIEARIATLKEFLCGWEKQTSNCEAAKKYDHSRAAANRHASRQLSLANRNIILSKRQTSCSLKRLGA